MRHAAIKETLIYAPYNVGKGRLAMKSLDEAQAVEMTPEWGGSSNGGEGGIRTPATV